MQYITVAVALHPIALCQGQQALLNLHAIFVSFQDTNTVQ